MIQHKLFTCLSLSSRFSCFQKQYCICKTEISVRISVHKYVIYIKFTVYTEHKLTHILELSTCLPLLIFYTIYNRIMHISFRAAFVHRFTHISISLIPIGAVMCRTQMNQVAIISCKPKDLATQNLLNGLLSSKFLILLNSNRIRIYSQICLYCYIKWISK